MLSKPSDFRPYDNLKETIARYPETEERYELERAEDLARWRRYVETGVAAPHEEAAIRLKALANH